MKKPMIPSPKISKSINDTFDIAKKLGKDLKPPVLIGLSGELGSGKTVFAKGLAEALNVKELITSPTFLGINEYYSGTYPFIHMDFYKKVVSLKIIEMYLQKPSIVLIEWVENFQSVFNEKLNLNVSVQIQYLSNANERQIVIK